MIVSHKHKFIFIKTRKTAGTSIEIFLSRHCGKTDIITPITPGDDNLHKPQNYRGFFNPFPETLLELKYKNRDRKRTMSILKRGVSRFVTGFKYYGHIPACIVRSRISSEIWDGYYKFCVERNPWDKELSNYYWKKSRKGGNYSFDDYMTMGSCADYNLYTDPNNGAIIVDRVVKYENLMNELQIVFDSLGIPFDGSLNSNAKGGFRKDRRSYQEVFSDVNMIEYREIIRKRHQKGIELFNYKF